MLIDVGGTLWPNTWPSRPADTHQRVERLVDACALTEREATELAAELSGPEHPPGDRQMTATLIRDALARVAPERDVRAQDVSSAMCLPAARRVEPFDGAGELLTGLHGAGERVVIVSNVMWRDAGAHRRDFEALGWAGDVDAYVTSLEVGWRKPHPAFFDAALAAADCPADQCAMVGDNERNDIEPARDRGMLTIRVAIEERSPPSHGTAADAVCTDLREVARLLEK